MSEHKRNVWQPAWRVVKQKHWWRDHLGWKLLFVGVLLAGFYAFSSPVAVHAYPVAGGCSYPAHDCGYFIGHNVPEPYDFVFPCGLFDGNKTTFETDIINYTNGTIPAGQQPPACAPNLGNPQYQAGGSFIILTMLGYPAGTAKAVARQAAVQAKWKTLVDYYAANGWIDFNYTLPNNFDGCRNTAYQISQPDIATLTDCQNGAKAIKFEDPANPGQHYVIKQQCGNPIGILSALEIPQATCGNVTATPGLIQPGQNFTVKVNVTYANNLPPPYTAFHVSIPDVPYTNNAAGVAKANPNLSFTSPSLAAPPAGTHTVSWRLYDGATAESPQCSGTFTVTDLPYFSVFGGDVDAGGGFAPTCGTTGGNLEGWYDNQAAIAGANTLFSAVASGQIVGFGSAQSRGGANPRPTGLTFANSGGGAINTNANSPDLGGDYGGSHCFYTPTAPAGAASPGGTSFTPNAGDNGAYTFNAAQFTLNGGSIGIGKNVAVYVNGDVYISGNISYAGTGGGWSVQPDGTSNIPSFILEASGNIYIDKGVTNLDGIYVAHDTIYTCSADTGFGPHAENVIYFGCGHQLRVNGSFTAQQINLMRSAGSLNQATAGENMSSPAKNCDNDPVNEPVCAAEIFNFSPEMYLSSPAASPPNNGAPTYDAITSLPPVL